MIDIPLDIFAKNSKLMIPTDSNFNILDLIRGSEKFYYSSNLDDIENVCKTDNALTEQMTRLPYPVMTINLNVNGGARKAACAFLMIEKSYLRDSGIIHSLSELIIRNSNTEERFSADCLFSKENGYFIFRIDFESSMSSHLGSYFLSPVARFISYEKNTGSDFEHLLFNFHTHKATDEGVNVFLMKSILMDYYASILVNRINQTKMVAVEKTPSATKNRIRKMQGKPLLFSYKELSINTNYNPTDSINRNYSGGFGTSPRTHTRRGHYRNYKSGKQVWIDNIIVNKNGKKGSIEKVYKVA